MEREAVGQGSQKAANGRLLPITGARGEVREGWTDGLLSKQTAAIKGREENDCYIWETWKSSWE